MTELNTHSKIRHQPMSAAAACSRAWPPPAGSCSPRSSRRVKGALAGLSDRRRRHAERRRQQPEDLRLDRQRRHRQHRRGPRRDGQRRRAHRAADDGRRRARGRLGARARRAVARRREDLRQPGHRRLAQRAPLHPADAPVRRRGAARCWRRPPPRSGASTSARSRRSCTRSCTSPRAASSATASLPRMPRRCRCRPPTRSSSRRPSAFRYIGKGNVRIADIVDITTGKAIYGQDVMLPGMKFAVIARPPVVGGKVASARLERGHEGAGRGEDRARSRRRRRRLQVRAARRRRRHRQEHLGGAQGPRGAQDHLGRRAQQGLRLQGLQGPARGGREEARQGRAQRGRRRQGAGLRRQGDHGRVLRAPHPACDHGAAGGHRAHEKAASGRCGRRCRAPAARATTSPRRSASSPRTWCCTPRCSAAASAASPSATSPSRRRCCPRRWAARRSRWCGRARTTSGTASITP